jgi:endonuclease-3
LFLQADAGVNKYTPVLFAKAKTPKQMVQLSIKEIEKIIRPIGLAPQKAKAIWNLSQDLLDNHRGQVPSNFKDLEALPGVGHKTASVVMVQAFHKPAFPVDTHIHRCAKRWGLSSGKNVKTTEEDLKKLFPKSAWGKIHLQIIYFARAFCKALGHHTATCPICSKLRKAS